MAVIIVPLFVFLVIIMIIAQWGRAYSILEKWAGTYGYQILESERRKFRRGPFFFLTGTGQVVYRVTVQDSAGQIRRGYVRCGDFFLGVFSDRADVMWDAEPPHQPGFPVVMKDGSGEEII